MYMKKFLPILPIIIGLLVAGFLFWNIVPKKITVGDVTFETVLCPRMFAFNQTTTLMQIKDKNQRNAAAELWEEYIHSNGPQQMEEYNALVARVVGGISEQLGPGYEVRAFGTDFTQIFVTNLKKKAKEDVKTAKAKEAIKNL